MSSAAQAAPNPLSMLVKPSHSHVNDSLHPATEALESDCGLLGHRQIRRTCADHAYAPGPLICLQRANRDASSPLVKRRFWQSPANRFEMRSVRPRCKHRLASLPQRHRDSGNLGRKFSLTENRFGTTAAPDAVEIHPGESEISSRFSPHRHENTFASGSYCFRRSRFSRKSALVAHSACPSAT